MRRLILSASLATLLPLAGFAGTLSKTDRVFLHRAAAGNMTEVAEGKQALTMASSPAIKAFAEKMVAAHTAGGDAVMKLAAAKGVHVPTTLPKRAAAQLASETALSGPAFDRTYVVDQIKNHEMMAKAVQKELDAGTDPDAKAMAAKLQPVVQDHLQMAEGLKTS